MIGRCQEGEAYPRNETLVETENSTAAPDASQGSGEAVATVSGHGGLDDLEGLAERRYFLQPKSTPAT